jgi:hypothetical protein
MDRVIDRISSTIKFVNMRSALVLNALVRRLIRQIMALVTANEFSLHISNTIIKALPNVLCIKMTAIGCTLLRHHMENIEKKIKRHVCDA